MRPCFASCYERPSLAEDPAPGPPALEASVSRCSGLNGSDEPCGFIARFDPAHCSQAVPCDGLIAIFASSEEECGGYGRVLRDFAEAGYVASCMYLFESNGAADRFPLLALADRVDRALEALTASEAVNGRWTGRYVFFSGEGMAGTAPVVAMARTDLDEAAHWRGDEITAACFLDGFYDLSAADVALGEGEDGLSCSFPMSHAELLARYYAEPPDAHDCTNQKCPCGEAHAPAIDLDSVVDADPQALAVRDWALVECGSALDACTGDLAPAEPIATFCAALEADADHTCRAEGLPRSAHQSCMSFGADVCLAFFEELTAR
jgi:hypothetical protein